MTHPRFTELFGVSRANADLAGIARNACRDGLAVVPVKPNDKAPACTLTDVAKRKADREAAAKARHAGHRNWSRVRHPCGKNHAITEPELASRVFRRLAEKWPKLNIALEVGRSHMLLVDADHASGVTAFAALWAQKEGIPDLAGAAPTVRTPGKVNEKTGEWTHKDGGHFWFSLPDGVSFEDATISAPVKGGGFEIYFRDRIGLVPPSDRDEGSYEVASASGEAPAWLIDMVREHVEAHTSARRKRRTAVLADGDPIDAWAAEVSWEEILASDGWELSSRWSNCGCPEWTRPGDWSNVKSATAHEIGCVQYDTGCGHAPLHWWTDNPPEFLARYTDETGKKTLSKLTYLAWRDHDGDTSAAMANLDLSPIHEDDITDDELFDDMAPSPAEPVEETLDEEQDHQEGPAPPSPSEDVPEHDQEPPVPPDPLDDLKARLAGHPKVVRNEAARIAVREMAREVVDAWREGLDADKWSPPAFTSLDDLLAEPDDGPVWRVTNLWPSGGRVVLSAQFKAGKTVMVGNLVRCLADGDPFLDADDLLNASFMVTPLQSSERVAVIDLELSRQNFRRWLAQQGIMTTSSVRAQTLRGRLAEFDILSKSHRNLWAKLLHDAGIRVLVIDPLAPLLQANGIEENDNSGIAKVLGALDEMCESAGVSELLVTHHMGHNGERSRGASRLRDWPDAEWKLVRESDESGEPPPNAARFFSALGRDVEVVQSRLSFDPTTKHLSLVGGSRAQYTAIKWESEILRVVREEPGATGRAINDRLKDAGVPRDAGRQALRNLLEGNTVHTFPGGRNAIHHVTGCDCLEPKRCLTAGHAAGISGLDGRADEQP